MPIESLTTGPMGVAEATHGGGYAEYKAASVRIVDMLKQAHFEELNEFLTSTAGERWAARSLGLGKGATAKGR